MSSGSNQTKKNQIHKTGLFCPHAKQLLSEVQQLGSNLDCINNIIHQEMKKKKE